MSVEEMVMLKYPKQLEERTCAQLRQRRHALREAYRKRLIDEQSAKNSIQPEERTEAKTL